ncbi:DNA/RNA polymerases superfamily protein [Rhynchospora pubera]|uniref:DNA/RNA polymerases superfamily protein n=1 Tax=Rhynchospora pubera TaxID=906938 RepID=A0AAV8DYI3_9POAL|nr:DNA/RNA polymerases superfamily protein [Rhynchospora pubera]
MEQPTPRRGRGRPQRRARVQSQNRGRGRTQVPARGRGRGRGPVEQGDHAVPQANPVPQNNPVPPEAAQEGLGQQLLAGLTQLVGQAVGRAQEVLDPFTIAYHEFLRHQTPRYDGSGNYDAAEEWLLAVQDTFRLARTPVEHWTELAATRFDRDARLWWGTQQPQFQGDGRNIPWDWFTGVFRARFMGATQQEELRRRFETLTQGTMTARQYGETFLRLSHYAPDLVADPQRRRDRFIRGLIPDLALSLDSYPGTSIEFLMDKAVFLETLIAARDRSRQDQMRSSTVGPRRVALPAPRQPTAPIPRRPVVAVAPQGGRYFCSVCQRYHSGPCTRQTGGCHICQSPDHWKADCPRNTGRTFPGSSSGGGGQAVPNRPPTTGTFGRGIVDAGRGRGGFAAPRGIGRTGPQRGGRFGHGGRGAACSGQTGRDTARVHATIGEDYPDYEAVPQEDFQDAQDDADLIAGMVSVSNCFAYSLIDTGASHSFVSETFVKEHRWTTEPRNRVMVVQTPLGKNVLVDRVCRNQKVQITGRNLPANLVVLDMRDFDILLGLDWLSTHHAVVDCKNRSVRFGKADTEPFVFKGRKPGTGIPIISAMQVKHLISLGCEMFLASVMSTDSTVLDLETVPVVPSDAGNSMMASLVVKPTLMEEIKQAQQKDARLEKVRATVTSELTTPFRVDEEGVLRFRDRICVPDDYELKGKILSEAHESGYTIHPGETKMYRDLKGYYWWRNMRREVARFVAKCLVCQKVKADKKASRLTPSIENVRAEV